MHIYEGVLAGTPQGQAVLLGAAAATAAGTAWGLYRLDQERIPKVAVLSSAFFVASLIHVPLPPTSIHLTLTGLLGLVLGRAAFPAVLMALLLQAVFFGVGGVTTLGVNTLVMALPAVACYYLFGHAAAHRRQWVVFAAGFGAGFVGILFAAVLAAAALFAAGKQFQTLGQLLVALHLPAAALEGLITGSVVVLLRKVRPEVLGAPLLSPVGQEVLGG